MNVLKLTEEQKNLLVGQEFKKDSFFSPTLDNDGNWFISIEERDWNENEEFSWINDLEEIPHNPIPFPLEI